MQDPEFRSIGNDDFALLPTSTLKAKASTGTPFLSFLFSFSQNNARLLISPILVAQESVNQALLLSVMVVGPLVSIQKKMRSPHLGLIVPRDKYLFRLSLSLAGCASLFFSVFPRFSNPPWIKSRIVTQHQLDSAPKRRKTIFVFRWHCLYFSPRSQFFRNFQRLSQSLLRSSRFHWKDR